MACPHFMAMLLLKKSGIDKIVKIDEVLRRYGRTIVPAVMCLVYHGILNLVPWYIVANFKKLERGTWLPGTVLYYRSG